MTSSSARQRSGKKGFSLDRLQVLAEVAEAGSLIKAAGNNDDRASQFCRQIKQLEEHFGFDLSGHSSRQFALTEAGAELAGIALEFFRALEDFNHRGRRLARRYTIGAGEAFLQWLVIPRLRAIRKAVPGAHLRLRNLQNSQIVPALEERTLDFGVIRRRSLHKSLEWAPLGSMSYCLAVPRALLDQAERTDVAWLLEKLPFAAQSERSFAQTELEQAAASRGIRINTQLQCDTFPDGVAALRTGIYTALLPKLPGLLPALPGVKLVDIDFMSGWACEMVLAWNPRFRAVRANAERVRDHLVSLLAWPDA